MLNLVQYRQPDGRDEYLAYSRGFIPLLKRCGGTILWAGDVTGVALGDDAADDWDYAVLVQYPDRQAFVDVMTSDDYAAINRSPARRAGPPRDPAGVRDVLQVRRLTHRPRRRGGRDRATG